MGNCLLKAFQQVCDTVKNRSGPILNTTSSPYNSMPHRITPSASLDGRPLLQFMIITVVQFDVLTPHCWRGTPLTPFRGVPVLCHLFPSCFPLILSLAFCWGASSGLVQGAKEAPYTHKFSAAPTPELAPEGLDELQFLSKGRWWEHAAAGWQVCTPPGQLAMRWA